MPKLSELRQSKKPTIKLSELRSQNNVNVNDLPTVGGAYGFSDEFNKATGQSRIEGLLSSFKPTLSDVFGSYEDVANSLQKVAPGAKLVKDANDYEVLELPSGERFAMNKPGIQGHEVASAIANTAAFYPAGMAAGLTTGVIPKAIAAGSASGVIDSALQAIAGKDSIDPHRTMYAVAGGALGETVAPIASGVGKAAKDSYRWLNNKVSGYESALAKARELAKQIGIENPTDKVAFDVLKRWDEIKAGASPESIVGEADIGLKLTRGAKTGDTGQLRREEMIRNSDSKAGQLMRDVDTQNREAIESYITGMRNKMAPDASGTVSDAIDRVSQGVREKYNAANEGVQQAYENVSGFKASVPKSYIAELPERLSKSVADFAIDKELTPATAKILAMAKQKVSDLPEEVSAVTLKAIETERQRINNSLGAAANRTDRKALMAVKNEFDNWYFDLADNAILNGDTAAIDAIKKARAARTSIGERFEERWKNDIGGRLVQKVISNKSTPEEIAQAAFGTSHVSKASSTQFVRKLKKALTPDGGEIDPLFGEVKQAVLQKMVTGKNGEMLGMQGIVKNIKESLNSRQSLMKELYTPEELSVLSRTANTLDAITPKGMLAKSSGTSERAYAYLEQMLNGIPLGGTLLKALQAPANAATARSAYMPVTRRGNLENILPATGAAYGSNIGDE